MAKVTFEDGTVINFDGKPSAQDIDDAYSSLKGKGSPSQDKPPLQPSQQDRGNILRDIGKSMLGVVRDTTKPLVETSAHTLQGLEGIEPAVTNFLSGGLINRPTGNMRTYDVPFYGKIPPIENLGQGVGNALQTSSLALGQNPTLMGAMFAGGGSIGRNESPLEVAGNTALGAGAAKGLSILGDLAMGVDKNKLAQEATDIYRRVLRPTKSEINKVEVGQEKHLDNFYSLAAKEGLPIKKSGQNTLDTREAVDILQQKQSVLHEQLNKELSQDTKTTFNLKEIGKQAKDILGKVVKNASELKTVRAHIDDYIAAEIENSGEVVNAQTANTIKQGMWSVAYNKFDPAQNAKADSARVIGSIINKNIAEQIPNTNIQSLNKMSGEYATLERLLENAHGRPVPKGFLGKIVGAITGHSLKSAPVAGPLLGQKIGGGISDILNDPEMLSKFASWKMKRALR